MNETSNLEWRLIEQPSAENIEAIRSRLQEHNAAFWEVQDKQTKVLWLSAGGPLLAGTVVTLFGQWLEVSFLWVDESLRGSGIGTRIMNEIEALAKKHKCSKLCLNTFSFQARPFYEKNGFTVVYERSNYPVTSSQYFMEKVIL